MPRLVLSHELPGNPARSHPMEVTMSRFIARLAAGACVAALVLATTACAVMPAGSVPVAQDMHDYVGSGTD